MSSAAGGMRKYIAANIVGARRENWASCLVVNAHCVDPYESPNTRSKVNRRRKAGAGVSPDTELAGAQPATPGCPPERGALDRRHVPFSRHEACHGQNTKQNVKMLALLSDATLSMLRKLPRLSSPSRFRSALQQRSQLLGRRCKLLTKARRRILPTCLLGSRARCDAKEPITNRVERVSPGYRIRSERWY